MPASGYLAVYCLLVVLASLLGGWLPSLVQLTHKRLQLAISVVAGLMLGVALFHLLPHAAIHLRSLEPALAWMMAGLLSMFFLMRGFAAHQHGDIESPEAAASQHAHEHDHAQDHGHCEHAHGRPAGRGVSWIGIAVGLSLHTLMDGVALGAAVTADSGEAGAFAGLGTFLAVALHKPLDSMSITTLMASQGWSARSRQVVNVWYALICPLGAVLFALGISHLGHDPSATIGAALAFAAGVFVCIALADLLPEVQFHTHDRFKLSAALLIGVAIAYAVGLVEPHNHPGDHDLDHGHHHHDGH
jgi:zinc and cadmium transporter